MNAFFKIMRPEQWVKNLFVFIPAFFAGELDNVAAWGQVTLGFLAFCGMASCIYVVNDYADMDADRIHPLKKNRPLASGAIKGNHALLLAIGLLILSVGLSWLLTAGLFWVLLIYLIINLLYSFWLKHVAILDVTLIAIGFLLRVFAGGVVAGVPISHWLIVLTFLLAMILALSKRRGEFSLQKNGQVTRRSLEGYNLQFIDMSMVFMAAVTVVAYLMYTLSEEVMSRIGSDQIYFTTIFVVIGILRYLQLTLVFEKTSSPTSVLWKDRFIQIILLLWIAAFAYLLYS